MKKGLIRAVNLALIVGILLAYNITIEANETKWARAQASADAANMAAETESVVESEPGQYTDGIYAGTAEGFGGPVKVSVTVASGRIETVEILSAESEDGAYLEMAKDVIDEIIDDQTSQVDVVSGATFSSNGIINAVGLALEGAQK